MKKGAYPDKQSSIPPEMLDSFVKICTYFITWDNLQTEKNSTKPLKLSLKTTFGDTKNKKWIIGKLLGDSRLARGVTYNQEKPIWDLKMSSSIKGGGG